MNVAFRVDASLVMGSGHVMRCLTLAEELVNCGADVIFICRELPGNLCAIIEAQGFTVFRLPRPEAIVSPLEWNAYARWLEVDWQKDACECGEALVERQSGTDLLVVDHYALDFQWEGRLRGLAGQIMVIDDLADRSHDCDLLLDQNLYQEMEKRYQERIPVACRQLLGPDYALVRAEFHAARKQMPVKNRVVRNVLVFLGGSDPENSTATVLKAMEQVSDRELQVKVIIGASNPFRESLEDFCFARASLSLLVQVNNMAELMAGADLMIGAGGATTWERCLMGLPSIIVAIAENQVEIAKAVDQQGAARYLGRQGDVTQELIVRELIGLLDHPENVVSMQANAERLVDGYGARRVARELLA